MTVTGQEVVGAAQEGHGQGQVRCNIEGPCPPDVPRQKNEGVRAREIASVTSEDAHAGEELVLGKVEALCDPGGLERGEVEAANGERALETRDPLQAKRTVAIVEDPSARPGAG